MMLDNEKYLDRFTIPIADIEGIKYDLGKENLNQETSLALSQLLGQSLRHLEVAKLIVHDINSPLSSVVKKKLFDSLRDR